MNGVLAMNEQMKELLERLAKRKCWFDDDKDDVIVEDYAGGNVDDAYNGGYHAGQTRLARELLSVFGE
jgi:hypothetical protein